MAVSLVGAPQGLLAQEVGDRVRATTMSGMLVGRITAVSANGFELALDGAKDETSFSVAHAEIISLEGSRMSWWPWVASALGGLVGHDASCSDRGFLGGCKPGAYEDTARHITSGVAFGGVFGFAAGWLLSGDRWVPIQVGRKESAFRPVVRLDFHGPSAAVVGLRPRL